MGPEGSVQQYEFRLFSNYPNPFNPSTNFRYTLPRTLHVTLEVYDVLGQRVASVVDETQGPGEHTVQWNAASLASGVYFYRLRAGEFAQARKLVLMK